MLARACPVHTTFLTLMSSAAAPAIPLPPGLDLGRLIRFVVAFVAPTRVKERLLESMADVIGEEVREALKEPEPRKVLDRLTAQPVVLEAVILTLQILGRDLWTKSVGTVLPELGHNAHQLLPKLSEKARTWVRATAFLSAELLAPVEAETGGSKDKILQAFREDRSEARRIAALWFSLLVGGSFFGIAPQVGEDFALELWTKLSKGVDEELIESCYWTAAHVEAKAAA